MTEQLTQFLEHWGVRGMHWGIRRGGSPSDQANNSTDHSRAEGLRYKKLSELSNDDIKALTTRLQLEKQLKDVSATERSFGQKFVEEALVGAGKEVAKTYAQKGMTAVIEKIIKEAAKSKVP